MELREAITYALDSSAYQVMRVFEGLNGEQWDEKVTDISMTPREIVVHLTECCHGALAALDGEPYEWGSYKAESTDPESLMDIYYNERRGTVQALTSGEVTEKNFKTAIQYITMHEAYHVGQVVLLRMRLQPEWDPYSILEH